MAKLYYDIRVDMAKTAALDTGYRFTQGDAGEETLRIAVMNGSAKYEASDATPTLNFSKPDGTVVVGTPELVDDVWVYTFLGSELAAAGKVLCDIKFDFGNSVVSSAKFTFFVERNTVSDSAVKSSSYISKFEELLEEADAIIDSIETDAETAQSYITLGEGYAQEAESYAHGNTGSRTDEDTDNAMYYAQQAASTYSDMEDLVEDLETLAVPSCEVDTSTMHLMFSTDEGWGFEVSEESTDKGHLIWTIN